MPAHIRRTLEACLPPRSLFVSTTFPPIRSRECEGEVKASLETRPIDEKSRAQERTVTHMHRTKPYTCKCPQSHGEVPVRRLQTEVRGRRKAAEHCEFTRPLRVSAPDGQWSTKSVQGNIACFTPFLAKEFSDGRAQRITTASAPFLDENAAAITTARLAFDDDRGAANHDSVGARAAANHDGIIAIAAASSRGPQQITTATRRPIRSHRREACDAARAAPARGRARW